MTDNGKRILLVEDETMVRKTQALILNKYGYSVRDFASGREAISAIHFGKLQFDIAIVDIVMPELSGPEFVKLARPLLGDLPVLFFSAYKQQDLGNVLDDIPNAAFLSKPGSHVGLIDKIEQMIADHARPN